MEKLWTIVQFINEDTVEAVPSTWIFNNKCYWPPFEMEKIVAAIKKHAEPNTCWPSYDIKTFRNSTYNNYATAMGKAKKAELTSDLTSDAGNDIPKRKIIPKKFSLSSDEGGEEYMTLPTPPSMQKSSKINRESVLNNKCQLNTVNRLPEEVSNKRTKHSSDAFSDTSNNYTLQNDDHNARENETDDVCRKNDDVRDIKKELLQQVHQRQNVNKKEESIFSFFHLPLNSVEDLEQQVEQFLNQPNNFETSVKDVSRVGGKNPYEFIKRNCTLLITNDLAEKYSWLGAKQKRKFCQLKFADLLIVSSQDSNSTYTRKVLEQTIQKWLRRAKERLNAKKKLLNQDDRRSEEEF